MDSGWTRNSTRNSGCIPDGSNLAKRLLFQWTYLSPTSSPPRGISCPAFQLSPTSLSHHYWAP
jgi:hypothetical protein